MTDDDIKAARALCEAATPGAWAFMDEAYPWVAGAVDEDIAGPSTVVEFNECGEQAHADARFIAAARTLLPAALKALAEARRDVDHTRDGFRQSHDEVIRLMRDADDGREFDRRNVAEIDRLSADLAVTKAALAEAVNLLEQAHDYRDDSKIFAACVAALKAKVRP